MKILSMLWNQVVALGDCAFLPCPTCKDYSFKGLDAETSGGTRIMTSTRATENLTALYTQWTAGGRYPADALYMVIDVSGGTSASSYSVSYMDCVPSGGWSDTYKTSKIVMRWIAPGTFTMGTGGSLAHETEIDVTLTEGYWMGVFEVTQCQWEQVMGSNPTFPRYRGDKRPVVSVSYNTIRGSLLGSQWPANSNVDSTSFMGKLRAKTGQAFDLPTEAQWEYACRASTTTDYNNGKNCTTTYDADSDAVCLNLNDIGRYGGNENGRDSADVGSYAPNAWGLYDCHGNVWEWCKDWYGLYGSLAVTNPKGATSGDNRVFRGGSWCNSARLCRSAYRFFGTPTYDGCGLGFRLASTLVQK